MHFTHLKIPAVATLQQGDASSLGANIMPRQSSFTCVTSSSDISCVLYHVACVTLGQMA